MVWVGLLEVVASAQPAPPPDSDPDTIDRTVDADTAKPAAAPEDDQEPMTMAGEEIIITGTRSPEKRLDAPVTVEIVTEEDLRTAGGAGYMSALSRVKGIDFADTGVNEQRVSMRGFNTQFNSRMVTMLDGRLAQLPGSGLPQGNLLPAAQLDLKSIEVVVGPASALYGPNAHTGVINVSTKSPWDRSGVALSVRGGGRNLVDGAARIAGTVSGSVGYKLNAQYLRADDFEPDRSSPTHYYGTNVFEGDLLEDYGVRSAKTDGTLYYRFGDWVAKGTAGYSLNDGYSLTNAGRNHIRDWVVQFQTAQLTGPHWFAQVTRTATDAGGTYQMDRLAAAVDAMGGAPADPAELDDMRDAFAFVDSSQLVDSDLQYRDDVLGVKTTAGVQYRVYLPSSDGTYLDDADESLSATEVGGYLQLDRHVLDDRLRIAGAARVDHHSNYPTQVSPKASLQYKVAPMQNVRVAYNRAFKSPTILESYLLINGILVGNRTGFEIRDAGGNVLRELPALEPEGVNALELGYKGAFARKVFVDAVAYSSWYENFISPLTQQANPAADEPTFAFYPDGTPVGAGTPAEGALFTYTNFGSATVRGVDVGIDYLPMPELGVTASASYISLAEFSNDDANQADLLLNVPAVKLKGSVTVRDLGVKDYFVRVSGRFHTAYEFASGYWNSERFFDDGKVPSRVVADVTAGWQLPAQGLTVQATVANLLDNQTPDVLGAPTPRRFAFVQLSYDWDGLKN